WRHSFLTACLCRQLNQAFELGFRGEEFSCGLSHDLGRILIAIGVPGHFDAADPMDFLESPAVLEHERGILGVDHCQFGAWFATMNQLPPSLVSGIELHHTPGEVEGHQRLVALVSAADDLANHLQREQSLEGYDLATNSGWEILANQVGSSLQGKINESVPA